jgi:protein pelota
MRIVHEDPRTGTRKLLLQTPSDLWRTARLIRPGDRVGASTTRRDPEVPEDTPGAQRDRRRVFLVITAEQVEFHGFSQHVRVTGPIVEGPFDLGRHHTLDIDVGETVSVQKDGWTAGDRALLEEGLAGAGEPKVVLASVDWGESTLVRLRGRSVETIADVRRTLAGKREGVGQAEKDRGAYLAELVKLLRPELAEATVVVVAGPGFLKEQLAGALAEAEPAQKGKVKLFATAEAGRSGLHELMRSGKAAEALRGSVAAEEADLVERLVTALGGARAAVGPAEVAEAVDGGAAETVLISESLLSDAKSQATLDAARSARARVFVVRDDGESGQRLHGLGGIGALLRYEWAPEKGRGAASSR